MQLRAALQAVLLARLLAGLRGVMGRLLSGEYAGVESGSREG